MQLRKIQLAGIRTLTADCCSAIPAIELAASLYNRSHWNRRFCNVDGIYLSLSIQKVIEFLFMLVLGGNLKVNERTQLTECCKTEKLRNVDILPLDVPEKFMIMLRDSFLDPICASVCYILSDGSTVEHASDTALRFIRFTAYKKTKALLLQVESTSQLRACGWIGSL